MTVETIGQQADEAFRDLSLPPHSLQAEAAVLGAILKRPEALAAISGLRAEDFYHGRHRLIFAAMRSLDEQRTAIDYHTLGDELQRRGVYEQSGGLAFLSELNLATPTAAHVEHYAAIVQRTATMRRLISAAQAISEMAYRDELEADAAIAKAWQFVQDVRQATSSRRVLRPQQWVDETLEALEKRQQTGLGGISTGFVGLDAMLLGLSPGDLVLLAARMRVGKTALVQQIAHAAERYGPVLFVSQEMGPVKIGERALAQATRVSRSVLRSGRMDDGTLQHVSRAAQTLADGRLFIAYGTFDTPAIRAEAQHLAATEGPLALIVVDYLQLLTDRGSTQSRRDEDVGLSAKRLKELAVELQVPVIVPTQLNRDADGQEPTLRDIAESDVPARVADFVLALHRKDLHPNHDPADRGLLEVFVLKNRDLSDAPDGCRLIWIGEKYVDERRI